MHAADADVASRQGRLEARIEDLDASVSLLHTKMETIIGQLAAREPEKEETMPTTKHWTSKDLETFPDDGTRYEIIDGDLYVSHQPSWHHQYTCSQLIYVLQAWSHTTSLGAATGAPGLIFAEDQDVAPRSEEHTSELQSPCNLVCRLLLEKKKKNNKKKYIVLK